MIAGNEQVRSGAAGQAHANGHAIAQALSRGDHVGQNIRVLVGKELTRARIAALHFVSDQQPVVGIADCAQRGQVGIVGYVDAAFAKNRLNHHSDHAGIVRGNGLHRGDVVKRGADKAAQQGFEARVHLTVTVAVRVAMVRPWKLPSTTTIDGDLMPSLLPLSRASLMAASLASAPELQKKALSMPERSHKRLASLVCKGISYRLEVCSSVLA